MTSGDVQVGVGGLFAPGRQAAACRRADGLSAVAELRRDAVDPGGDRFWTLRRRLDRHPLAAEFLRTGKKKSPLGCSARSANSNVQFRNFHLAKVRRILLYSFIFKGQFESQHFACIVINHSPINLHCVAELIRVDFTNVLYQELANYGPGATSSLF